MAFTTIDLIKALKRKASVPAAQRLFDNEDLIEMLNEQLQTVVVPYLDSFKGEYFATYRDYPIDKVTNTYTIPLKAMGGKAKDVVFLMPNNELLNIPQLSSDSMTKYSMYKSLGFYMEGYDIKLYPASAQTPSQTMRVMYYSRPGDLKTYDYWTTVQSVDTNTNTITLSSVYPTSWTTEDTLDIISKNIPHQSVLENVSIVSFPTTTSITLSSVVGLVKGDFVCRYGEAAVVQYIPVELRVMLLQATANQIYRSMGDTKALEGGLAILKDMKSSMASLFSPRTDNEPKKITGKPMFDSSRRRSW